MGQATKSFFQKYHKKIMKYYKWSFGWDGLPLIPSCPPLWGRPENFFIILLNVMHFCHAGFHVICMTDACTYYSWNAWFKRMIKSYFWHQW
jgi:hypothetical protein